MALLTISGAPRSRWEEVAHGAAQLLGFELVSDSRLAQWMTEEFGTTALPAKAWAAAAVAILSRMAREHHLVMAFPGADQLFPPMPSLLRTRVLAPLLHRAGNLILEERIEKSAALARLKALDEDAKRLRKSRFGRSSPPAESYDLSIQTAAMDVGKAAEILAAAAARTFGTPEFLAAGVADDLQFSTRMELAKRGIVPAERAQVKRAKFGHPSERLFANLLDFYRIGWEYEPRSFPLQWDKSGAVTEAFTPDFYLPEHDLYVELTTMKQSLVTRKNRKVRSLRAIYPHVNIQVFYQKDFQNLIFKHGIRVAG